MENFKGRIIVVELMTEKEKMLAGMLLKLCLENFDLNCSKLQLVLLNTMYLSRTKNVMYIWKYLRETVEKKSS